MEIPEYRLFTALTVAALYDSRPAPGARCDELAAELAHFEVWSEICPANFLHKRELIAAELSRVRGDGLAAMQHYERAISAAHDAGMVQNEALAYELAAQYCRNAGFVGRGGPLPDRVPALLPKLGRRGESRGARAPPRPAGGDLAAARERVRGNAAGARF